MRRITNFSGLNPQWELGYPTLIIFDLYNHNQEHMKTKSVKLFSLHVLGDFYPMRYKNRLPPPPVTFPNPPPPVKTHPNYRHPPVTTHPFQPGTYTTCVLMLRGGGVQDFYKTRSDPPPVTYFQDFQKLGRTPPP